MTRYRGYRTKLLRNTTGTTYVQVPQVLEIGEVGSSRGQIDGTAFGDEWTYILGGIQDGSEIEIRLAFDHADTQHQAMKTDYDAGTEKKYHLEHPDMTGTNAGVEITTTPLSFRRNFAIDGTVEALITLKVVNPGMTFYTPA